MNIAPRNLARTDAPRTPDSRGLHFYHSDPSLKAMLGLYIGQEERFNLEPYLDELGTRVGAELDDLAREADKTPQRLEPRRVA